ncbi:MAG: dihydropyrimidinase [Pseudomonadota bacterium]
MFDLKITNARVSTAADTFDTDIGIKDGTITALGTALGEAAETIDAAGRDVLPGGIDSHVHISQPSGEGIEMADDFASGTLSAIHGGNTTIMPFCMQERGESLRQALTDYEAKAEGELHCDVAFHLIISDPTRQVLGQELPAAVADGYTSFKVFMTYEMLRLNDAEILATMDVAQRTGALMMVHCENEDAIRFLCEKFAADSRLEPVSHALTRPVVAEREATHRAISLAEVVDVPVVIVHVSNGAAMREIERARSRGRRVVAETCTQYITLTEADLEGMDWEGAKFVCSPPPRDASEHKNIWSGIERGSFDLFSSDHCPFRYADERGKLNPKGRADFRAIPNGIPGVECRLPILFTEGVLTGRITINEFVALTATNHAKTYGLHPKKGTIAIGSDADLVIWERGARVIAHDDLHDGSDYSPYEGRRVGAWPGTVILRGRVMVADGVLQGEKGSGTTLKRECSPLTRAV